MWLAKATQLDTNLLAFVERWPTLSPGGHHGQTVHQIKIASWILPLQHKDPVSHFGSSVTLYRMMLMQASDLDTMPQ